MVKEKETNPKSKKSRNHLLIVKIDTLKQAFEKNGKSVF